MTYVRVNLTKAAAKLAKAQPALYTHKVLNEIGQGILGYIHMNFKTGGSLAGGWAPNKPNTIVKKGSNNPNVDSGQLEQSFSMKVGGNYVRVGSPSKKALWAEQGTPPHVITAHRQFLKFPVTDGMVFTPSVNHPGQPPRPILPTEDKVKSMAIVVMFTQWVGKIRKTP